MKGLGLLVVIKTLHQIKVKDLNLRINIKKLSNTYISVFQYLLCHPVKCLQQEKLEVI